MGTGAGQLPPVAVSDVDGAVGGNHHVARLVERVTPGRADAGCAQRHQQFAVRAELHGHVALALAVGIGAVRALRVGDPDVAVGIDVQPVRLNHEPGSEAGDEVSRRVEFQHGVQGEAGAGVAAAALRDPDVAPVPVHVDASGGSPRPAARQLRPPANGDIRIRGVILRRDIGLRGGRASRADERTEGERQRQEERGGSERHHAEPYHVRRGPVPHRAFSPAAGGWRSGSRSRLARER